MPPTKCAQRPAPPAADADDVALVLYFDAVDKAGADCRDKLGAVDAAVSAWPKSPTASQPK